MVLGLALAPCESPDSIQPALFPETSAESEHIMNAYRAARAAYWLGLSTVLVLIVRDRG